MLTIGIDNTEDKVMTNCTFTVLGTPIPKGSTRSFAIARGKKGAKVYTG